MTITRPTVSDRVKQWILDQISSGTLHPKDRLPTVRELAASLAVSHVSAARAVRSLAEDGIVKNYVGRGCFVADALPVRLRHPGTPGKPSGGLRDKLYFFFAHGPLDNFESYHAEVLTILQKLAGERSWELGIELLSAENVERAVRDPRAVGAIYGTGGQSPNFGTLPAVAYGMTPAGAGSTPSVTPDNYQAGIRAARLLDSCECSMVWYVNAARPEKHEGPPEQNLHFRERGMGVEDYFRSKPDGGKIYRGQLSWRINDCRSDVENLFSMIRAGTCHNVGLAVGNRAMALELTYLAGSFGISIPGELKIVCFINRGSSEAAVRLDTFDFSREEMAFSCMELLEKLRRKERCPLRTELEMRFFAEGSCRASRT
ncbi:MAG: GntR family transcriptional regulator [Victivallaceae bacterium]|nr:GntR family transcriptional regulator [Victivallaceae bacterium]